MRIAQIAPLIERVPPKKYGGTERVIYALTEELVKRGHHVTLFATGDSITSAELISVYPHSLREADITNLYERTNWTLQNIGLAYSMQNSFDVIHDHNGALSLPTANSARTPVVMTLHNAFSKNNIHIFSALNDPYFVTISKAQAKPLTELNYIGNVYNGLNMQDYPFSSKNDGYLLYVGRISELKGVHLAVEVARRTKKRLILAAKVDPVDSDYFEREIAPFLSEQIRWIGEVSEQERNILMSKAYCFLHPVTWPEPFGLTLIEAMACGAPVIAMNKGSIPEVVVHNKTGFVVESLGEMVEAVGKVDTIDRQSCRAHAMKNFTAKKMAEEYETIYEAILQKEVQRNDFNFTPSFMMQKS